MKLRMPSMELYSDAFISHCVIAYNWLTLQSILNIFAGAFIVQVAFFSRAVFVFAVATIAVSDESYCFSVRTCAKLENFKSLSVQRLCSNSYQGLQSIRCCRSAFDWLPLRILAGFSVTAFVDDVHNIAPEMFALHLCFFNFYSVFCRSDYQCSQ